MSTIAVRLPDSLKERVRRLKEKVDWPEEIRLFIEERARRAEAEDSMQQVIKILRKSGSAAEGFSSKSVREDRDSR